MLHTIPFKALKIHSKDPFYSYSGTFLAGHQPIKPNSTVKEEACKAKGDPVSSKKIRPIFWARIWGPKLWENSVEAETE